MTWRLDRWAQFAWMKNERLLKDQQEYDKLDAVSEPRVPSVSWHLTEDKS